MMQLGYSTWGMPTLPADVAIPYLAKLGFEAVELTVIPGWVTELSTLHAAIRCAGACRRASIAPQALRRPPSRPPSAIATDTW